MSQPFIRRQAPSQSRVKWTLAEPLPPKPLSPYSSPAVPNSGWSSQNFMLGAGMVIFQPSTHRIVVLYDTKKKYWFFPRGRKDVGESLEAAAIREAYEESGYRVEFLPLFNPTCAPSSPSDPDARNRENIEPIFITVTSWNPTKPGCRGRPLGGEYITSWYAGQIPEDAVYNEGTGMADEQNYTSHLCTYDEAKTRVRGKELDVLAYAWTLYEITCEEREDALEAELQEKDVASKSKSIDAQESSENNPSHGSPEAQWSFINIKL